MKSLFLLIALFIAGHAVAQDPPQFGDLFAGVPDPRDVSIYQVNIRAFSEGGDLKGVTQGLDRIKALGVNVVYLMPIYPVGTLKAVNSPYCVRNYKAVNPEFGSLEDLRALIKEAHLRGMAVLLDWVANHTAWDHPWITDHPDWYERDANGAIKTAGVGSNLWPDVAKLDLTRPAARAAMIEAMRYWVLAANCDGFRFDYAAGPPVDFWKEAASGLRSIPGHKLILYAEGSAPANYKVFDFNHGFSFYDALKAMFGTQQGPATKVDDENLEKYREAGDANRVVRYTTNHDVNGWDGPPAGILGGQAGSMAAFALVALNQGVPMIYNGQEVPLDYRLSFPFTARNIQWNGSQAVTDEYARIIRFRNGSEAIRRGTLRSFSNNEVNAILKRSVNEDAVVLINIRNRPVSFRLPPELAGTVWTDAFNPGPLRLGDAIELKPYEYRAGKSARTTLMGSSKGPERDPGRIQITGTAATLSGFSPGSRVRLNDIGGRTQFESILTDDAQTIGLERLRPGVYLLQVRSPDGKSPVTRRFLK